MHAAGLFFAVFPLAILAHPHATNNVITRTVYKAYSEECPTGYAPLSAPSSVGKPVTPVSVTAAAAATDDCPGELGAVCDQITGCKGGLVCCDVTNVCIVPGQVVSNTTAVAASATTPLPTPSGAVVPPVAGAPTDAPAPAPTPSDAPLLSDPSDTDDDDDSDHDGDCLTFLNAGDACDPNAQNGVCCGGDSACDTTTLVCVLPDF